MTLPFPTSSIYEPIKNALMTRIQNKCGNNFLTYSRKFMMWEQLTSDMQNSFVKQPALYLFDGVGLGGGKIRFEQRGRGLPVKRFVHLTIVVYARMPSSGAPSGLSGADVTLAGGTVFAPLHELIESVFLPDIGDAPGGAVTLGGLVSHVWLEGDGIWIPPDIDPAGQGMFTVPVVALIP